MTRAASPTITVWDVSHDPQAPLEARGAPFLDGLDFRPLGYMAVASPLSEPPDELVVLSVYASRYGDAIAFAEPFDATVRVRVLTVLASGTIIESRAIQAVADDAPEDDEPIAAVLAKLHLPVINPLLVQLASRRALQRYPSHPKAGLHRQALDVNDAASFWLAHRGLVHRLSGTDDTVADHQSLALAMAAVRRVDHVSGHEDARHQAIVQRRVLHLRNALLALPAALGLWKGLPWWMAGLLTGFTAAGALGLRSAMAHRSQRVWLVAIPVAVAIAGWLTIGWAAVFVTLLYALAVVVGMELMGADLIEQLFGRVAPLARRPPPPVPLPELLNTYGHHEGTP